MNGFNLSNIQDAKLGGTSLSAIYLGSNKLWPKAIDYSREYFTINSLANNNTISFSKSGSVETKTIYWSSDKITWNSVSSDSGTIKTLNKYEKIYIKGSNNNYASTYSAYNHFNSNAQFNISGNIMSLIYGDNFIGQTTLPSVNYIFGNIFRNSNVVDASHLILPATTLSNYCYAYMFYGCTSLTKAPALSATTLVNNCYYNMFYGCTSLTEAPALPATTLASNCYAFMFQGCTSLITAQKKLPATTLAEWCYSSMFTGCTSLVIAPDLPAKTLSKYCYAWMFSGCTRLGFIECLATYIPYSNSCQSWVSNVAATGTFYKAASMTSWSSGANGIPSGWTVENI